MMASRSCLTRETVISPKESRGPSADGRGAWLIDGTLVVPDDAATEIGHAIKAGGPDH